MRRHNAENERVKREYLIYLKAAKGLSEASLDTVAKALHRFEVSTKFRSLHKFHVEQAVAFACGPTAFVEAAATIMVKLGYPGQRVKTERFGGTGT